MTSGLEPKTLCYMGMTSTPLTDRSISTRIEQAANDLIGWRDAAGGVIERRKQVAKSAICDCLIVITD